MISLYVAWILTGTFFYAYAPSIELGIVKGFYMAINIGYSIGFGYPREPFENYLFFSSFYIILGASFVAIALGHFADKIGEDHDNWFTNLMQRQKYEEAFLPGTSLSVRVKAFLVEYTAPIRAVSLWLVWLAAMIIFALCTIDTWSFQQAQYFAVSTMSTGGDYPIPENASNVAYGVTAFLAMTGVPIMGVAMASIARLLTHQSDFEATKDLIKQEVTAEELEMLERFGLENGDGHIDRAEFIILCMVRTGTDPALINFISQRFAELDEDGGGTLSVHEITGGKFDFDRENGKIFNSCRNLASQDPSVTNSTIASRKSGEMEVKGLGSPQMETKGDELIVIKIANESLLTDNLGESGDAP